MRGPVALLLGVLALTLVTGCGRVPSGAADPPPATSQTTTGATLAPSDPATPGAASSRTGPSSSQGRSRSASPTPTCPAAVPARLSLTGEYGRAFAFAPLDDAGDVTLEGDVDGSQAWSTSKVLVAAAFLDTTADGDPDAASAADRRLIRAALTRSDGGAVRALRDQIPGSSGRAMTAVLRGVGDDRTTAPDSLEGTMSWTIREQVRFMAALEAGVVVSAKVSSYLIDTMRPIEQHQWGLGSVGSSTFKGGWLRQGRVTRQMGLLDGYAVAIITDRGPVVRQSDGDSAHVEAMDELAQVLADRLAYERRCG
jgi:hypothetical protein